MTFLNPVVAIHTADPTPPNTTERPSEIFYPKYTGHGNPNGVVTGNEGDTYLDLTHGVVFSKTINGGQFGWETWILGDVTIGNPTDDATYISPPIVVAHTTRTDWQSEGVVNLWSGGPPAVTGQYGMNIIHSGTTPTGGGGISIHSASDGIAITIGPPYPSGGGDTGVGSPPPNQIFIDCTGSIFIGSNAAFTIMGKNGGKIGFYGRESSIGQYPTITPPSGGSVIDVQARSAITNILDCLVDVGLVVS